MGDVVKETLNVAGLLTNVYARSNLRDSDKHSSEPIVALFFLHGRTESADSVDRTARAAFAWVDERLQASSSEQSPHPRDFVVVAIVRSSFTRAGSLLEVDDFWSPLILCGLAGPAEPRPENSG